MRTKTKKKTVTELYALTLTLKHAHTRVLYTYVASHPLPVFVEYTMRKIKKKKIEKTIRVRRACTPLYATGTTLVINIFPPAREARDRRG